LDHNPTPLGNGTSNGNTYINNKKKPTHIRFNSKNHILLEK